MPGSSLSASTKDTATSKPTSKKRKLDETRKRYYAVRVGRKPGVYDTYNKCFAQVDKFPGAKHKSFFSLEDAEAFVAGKDPIPADNDKKPPAFYAVGIGHKPGVYMTWPDAQAAFAGKKNPKYKRFGTYADAEAYVRQYNNQLTTAGAVAAEAASEDEDERAPKKAKTSAPVATSTGGSASVVAYTDGSALGNGRAGARSGVGVFFGPGDPRNISEPLQGETQTNQRAELTAILRCLEAIPPHQGAEIRTDSRYSIDCVTNWYIGWERNGYKTNGKDVKNQDLVKAIRQKLEEREKLGVRTQFTWVKGHSGDPGNEAADLLAVQGSRQPR
ncbi:ribonuclease H-like protein [Immersiella caudata]|uniref:Ribonuclease H n=1 Tax=Immersiella caudata TaxID=314043 RepID=A0AA40BX78_9PEZI|nr:ribonuclease H-like protein [Immersiella caudata]